MADDIEVLFPRLAATPSRPLLGITLLVVEDSRYACEAMRLLCLRSGARIRRADRLASARRHLASYQPTVVVVDLGLPDGSGLELIEALVCMPENRPAIIGMSGDPGGEAVAIAAGVDGFLVKPVTNLAHFQESILAVLPNDLRPNGPRILPQEEVEPDPVALRDDLAHAADILASPCSDLEVEYVTQFLGGLARSCDDPELEEAAVALRTQTDGGQPTRSGLARLAGLLQERLTEPATL